MISSSGQSHPSLKAIYLGISHLLWPLCRNDRTLLFQELVNDSWVFTQGTLVSGSSIFLCGSAFSLQRTWVETGSSNKERAFCAGPSFDLDKVTCGNVFVWPLLLLWLFPSLHEKGIKDHWKLEVSAYALTHWSVVLIVHVQIWPATFPGLIPPLP